MAQSTAGTTLSINSLFDVLNELHDVRTKWKMIGLGLRVPPPDLDAMSGSHQECLYSAVSKWLNGTGLPQRWETLVAILRSPLVDEKKKARELEEAFCSDSSQQSLVQVEDGASLEDSLSPPVAESDAGHSDNDLLSPAKPSIQRYIERITDPEVKKKIKRKDNKFRSLVRWTHRYISRTITTQAGFTDFQVTISCLPAYEHSSLSHDDSTAIKEATSFAQIFVILNQYWTFFQYGLLEYVIKKYGNDRLKRKMKAFINDMDELESQVPLDNLMNIKLCFSRPDSVIMAIHLPGSQHMLCDARCSQRLVADRSRLHHSTVRTYQSTPGSAIITLLVPCTVAIQVVVSFRGIPHIPADDILSRPLEERVIYTMDEAEAETYLPMIVYPAAELPVSTLKSGQKSGDSYSGASTSYESTAVDIAGGYEYEFLDDPMPAKYLCMICTKVLKDAHLTDCCGQNFCGSCLNNWFSRPKKDKTCPHCQQKPIYILNREKINEINKLRICCTHYKEGCDWVGELRALDQHLELVTGCACVKIECPYSQDSVGGRETYSFPCHLIRRKDLKTHMQEECEYRPYKCEHCGHEDTYVTITKGNLVGFSRQKSHYDKCSEYPLPCPNKCGTETIKRKDIDNHCKSCPLQPLDCPFKRAGCTEKIVRKDMENHMEHNTQRHILKLFHSHQELTKLDRELVQLNQELTVVVEKLE